MRSARALGSTSPRPWIWPLLACVAVVGLVGIVLATRMAMRPSLSQDAASLAAVGLAPITPPRQVPSLAFVDEAGHSMSLENFSGRGVVLNLWATWCGPCRQDMPALDRLQAKLGAPRFQVLAVSIDKQGATVVPLFYRELGLQSLGIFLDPGGKAASVLGIEGVPATLLIDAKGREIGRKLGAMEWDNPAVVAALRQSFRLTEARQ
jgi:thiol-disulfide isomerase/thioredoxin